MTKFKSMKDVADYPSLGFFPREMRAYWSVSADYNTAPRHTHAVLTFYPHLKGMRPSGEDQHWHVPLSRRNVKDLRDWLDRFLIDSDRKT